MKNLVSVLSNIKHLWQTLRVDLVDACAIRKCQQRPNTLLLVHLDAIGDYILFRNFIEALRKSHAYSGFTITLCGNEQYRDLAEWLDSGLIADFIWLDRRRFRFEFIYRFKMVRMICSRGFAVTVNSAASRIYYWGDTVVRASGSAERIGNAGDSINTKPWQKVKSDSFYTRLVPATGECLFEFLRNKTFFEDVLGETIPLAAPFIDRKLISASIGPVEPYAVLFPGAGVPFRRWSCEKFARIADHLWQRYGYPVVIAGSAADRELAGRIAALARFATVVDLTGKGGLPQLVGVIAHGAVMVSNETGAVHIAAAVGSRAVCISNGNHLGRFSPYPAEMHTDIRYLYPRAIMDCRDRFDELCERYTLKSDLDINEIDEQDVISEIDELLAENGTAASQGNAS